MNAPRTRVQRRPVHGVLLLDKPLGLSSNDALQKAKWLLRAEKAGHTGTLDPLATGVLPLCFGAATKFSQIQLDAPKTYTAIIRLGQTTTTSDAEGTILSECPVMPEMLTLQRLDAVAARFTGQISQIPPMHSALKKDGKALYEYARAGLEVERADRIVTIFHLALAPVSMSEWHGFMDEPSTEVSPCSAVRTRDSLRSVGEGRLTDAALGDTFPALRLTVTCSKGTYVRTLAQDIGEALGCGGHLAALRRIDTGGLDITRCITLDALAEMDEAGRLSQLYPADILLAGHVPVALDSTDAARFLSGLRRRGPWPDMPTVAVYGTRPHALLGVAHVSAGELIADRLLTPLEIEQILQQQAIAPHPPVAQATSVCGRVDPQSGLLFVGN